jgi:hypothetical protein
MHVVIKSGMREHDQRAESKRPNGAGETKRDEPSLFPCGLDSSDLSPLATTTSEGHTAREEQAGNNTKHWKAKTRYLIIPLFSFSKYHVTLPLPPTMSSSSISVWLCWNKRRAERLVKKFEEH